MKALMIVDLHDDFPFESAKADIRIKAGDKVIYRKHTKVRPMPEQKAEEYSKVLDYSDGDFARGWNSCIEEIEND